MEHICVKGIACSYGRKQVLRNVSFEAWSGTCTAIVGANGCGKTTLLGILAGLRKPDEGTMLMDEQKLLPGHVGYVPQESNLIPELTVKDNLLLWYQDRKWLDQELRTGFLHMLGIEEMLLLRAGKLSGGMKKRVSIGCALAQNPSVLLLDEPNAALDLPGKAEIRKYLSYYKQKGGAVIMATHDESDLELSEQVLCLREGKCHKIDRMLRGEELLREIV